MRAVPLRRRAGLPGGARLAAAALAMLAAAALCLLVPTPAPAQVPQDTLPADTLDTDTLVVPIPPGEVEADTLPRDDVLETEQASAVLTFPLWPDPQPEGWAYGRWEWDREELLRHHGLSLLELLEQVPGLVVTRAGGFGRAAGVSAWGLGGGRVRVFLDGWELDPLAAPSFDLQQIGLVDLAAVRVERSLLGIRIELSTFRLTRPTPFAQVEVGTGQDDVNLLRALFARPFGPRHVVTVSGGLTSTDGIGFNEPFKITTLNAAWSYALDERSALQLEYRTDAVQRQARDTLSQFETDFTRTDLVLRGRSRPHPGLALDAMLGRSSRDADALEDSLDADFGVTQAALRAAYEHRIGWLEGAARYRAGQTGAAAPRVELSARALLRPLPRLTAEAELRQTELNGFGGTEWRAVGRLGLAAGLSAYGEVAGGSRLTSLLRAGVDTVRTTVVVDSVERTVTSLFRTHAFPEVTAAAGGVRAGARWNGPLGIDLAAGVIRLSEADAVPFGLAFDAPLLPLEQPAPALPAAVEVDAVNGLEAALDVPLPVAGGALRLVGWYNRWAELGGRPYLPEEQGRIGLHFHEVFVEGQFEPTLRLDAVRRGSALVPERSEDRSELLLGGERSEPYTMVNLFLQLRIIDLRAFVLWENLLGTAGIDDLAQPFNRAPVVVYGVRWHFWN